MWVGGWVGGWVVVVGGGGPWGGGGGEGGGVCVCVCVCLSREDPCALAIQEREPTQRPHARGPHHTRNMQGVSEVRKPA